jgi:hypothetical protein
MYMGRHVGVENKLSALKDVEVSNEESFAPLV